jgi:apolipoprotein N-acyltransferase
VVERVSFVDALQRQRGIAGFLISAALGALGVFGHAPFHVWPAFCVSIAGLALLLDAAPKRSKPIRHGFGVAWAWAFGYFLAGMFWVGNAFLVDAEKFAVLMPFAVAALPAVLAVFWGVGGAVYIKLWRADASKLLVFATVFAVAEFARGHLFTGLPWNLPAYIWKPGGLLSQSSALFGPYGLSAATLFVLSTPMLLFAHRRTVRVAAFACVIAILGLVFGGMRLAQAGKIEPMAGSGPVIAAGQGGFTQKEVWDPSNASRVTQTYLDLLTDPRAQEADIVVWPEGAFPYLLMEQPEVLAEINARLGQRTLATGSVRRSEGLNGDRYWNSLFVVDEAAQKSGNPFVYDKHHLVPFGEYLPLRPLFRALGIASLVAYDGEMTPGAAPATLRVPGAPLADPRICYEIIFPSFNPDASGKAKWILNISIDAWYGDLLGPDQHYATARSRAIETGMPLVRAASGGWSAIVDRYGRPIAEHKSGAGYAKARLPLDATPTLYGRFGEALFGIFLFVLVVSSFLLRQKSIDFKS